MVGAGDSRRRQNFPGQLAQAALHPGADDGIADLLRDGEAEADRRVAVVARADEEDEAGRGRAQGAVRGEKVRAAPQLADSGRI